MGAKSGATGATLQKIADCARPLTSARDLNPLIERLAGARYVLLGEASHGTSEYYTWRTEITMRLVQDHGFSFVAVEGDWPDCYRVNRYVKALPDAGRSAEEVLHAFERWPTWMWANREVIELAERLRVHNGSRRSEDCVGFYGLDVYSLYDSMQAVVSYLEQKDPDLARSARRAYNCFEPFQEDVQEYARATYLVPTSCEDEAVTVLRTLRTQATEFLEDGPDAFFNAEQNAFVAMNAELYYRTMVRGGPTSWNVRDHHMVDTLDRLVRHHGPRAKAIVWEHNTHVGDARFTDMRRAGMVNVGQLVRERHEREGVHIVGFGSYEGSVIAGEEWGYPMERMPVPPAREGSWEDLVHRAVGRDSLFLFDGTGNGGIDGLEKPLEHRAIGVVYDPRRERWGNYVPTVVPRRYDSFIHVEQSRAVDPLHLAEAPLDDVPETFPSGM